MPGWIKSGQFVLVRSGCFWDSASCWKAITELIAKSLVAAEMGDVEPRLRLLETTRVYAPNISKMLCSDDRRSG